MTFHYSIAEIVPYINWVYFYHAWGVSSRPEAEHRQLRAEAMERLQRYAERYQTHAAFLLSDAYSDGDDVVVLVGDAKGGEKVVRIPFLRQQQQGSQCLCLADFIAPFGSCDAPRSSHQIGIFATTVDHGFESDFNDDPYEKMMMQLLADRLAEATAEVLHQDVRRRLWGYATDEQLSVDELLSERWQGIRPAVGYPSLPDTSLNFLIDQLIDMAQIGIRLTESGAMKPHASVSGLMIAHPAARYFTIGPISAGQLEDYAHRRGLPLQLMQKFLASNLQ